jgi:quercetin dioxygenase-like cupin family protein
MTLNVNRPMNITRPKPLNTVTSPIKRNHRKILGKSTRVKSDLLLKLIRSSEGSRNRTINVSLPAHMTAPMICMYFRIAKVTTSIQTRHVNRPLNITPSFGQMTTLISLINNLYRMKIWRPKPEAWKQVTEALKGRYVSADDKATAVLVELKPNSNFPKHKHPQVTYGLIIKGGGKYVAENGEFSLDEGDMYYIGPNEEHWLFSDDRGLVLFEVLIPYRDDLQNRVLRPDVE